ncbi:uncharacterized protein LOC117647756 [Thrips palmi]|uniref:Uncharacterized protein LOC117647756 n=1 Tax=Thrips palmi TaxID=161013 RepID=A0A6P8YZE2_THRPL|nr:uncharacterized protein LOC117647756 [Thrips palmi]
MAEELDDNLAELCVFVDLVQARPCLYDTENVNYKKKTFKENAWRLIGEAMDWEGDEKTSLVEVCIRQWKSIRDGFNRAMKKLPSGSGTPVKDTRMAPLWQKCSFLQNVKTKNTRKTFSNYTKKRKIGESSDETSQPAGDWGGLDTIFVSNDDGVEEEVVERNDSAATQAGNAIDDADAGPSSHMSEFETTQLQKPKKKPAPARINPPSETFSKKKVESTKKFEEMVSEGFKTFNALAQRQMTAPTKDSSATTL